MVETPYDEAPEQLQKAISWAKKLILDDFAAAEINSWVAGGALRSFFAAGEKAADIDLFFPTNEDREKAVKWFKDKGATETFKSDTVTKFRYKKLNFDVVRMLFPTPTDCIDHFDFTVACCAVDSGTIYYHDTFFIDLAGKRIVVHALPFPVSSLRRLHKYVQRGYKTCNGGLLSLAKAVNKLEDDAVDFNVSAMYID
jgi:hypothetical protein